MINGLRIAYTFILALIIEPLVVPKRTKCNRARVTAVFHGSRGCLSRALIADGRSKTAQPRASS